MGKEQVEVRAIALDELTEHVLAKFNRYQETHRVKYKDGDKLLEKDDHFIDNWDEDKKKKVVQALRSCIEDGGVVIGAFVENQLIGFANVTKQPFGKKNQYVQLPYLHVSNEFRHKGIGKQLFQQCCEAARQRGAGKLYIATHPALETQQFYASLGCVEATEINPELYHKQPLDLQLEYDLSPARG